MYFLVQIFKVLGWRPVKLLLIPGLAEAFFDGGLMIKIFKMPATFAFATGFILKAVGPALVIQAMFEVQQKRLGIRKGTVQLVTHHFAIKQHAIPIKTSVLWSGRLP